MAIRKTMRSAGRAVKYTAMEALADLAPTSIDLFRQTRSGIEDTRNYMRTNMSKIKTHSKTALDSGSLGASFRHYMDNSVGEIRKGNLAIRDISKGIEDDFDQIMAKLKTERPSDVGSSDAENAELQAQHTVSASDLGVDDSMIRMMAATGTGTVEALRELQGSMTQTQLSAAEYMTKRISTVLFSQMAMQNKHYTAIEQGLGAINKNLESLVTFQAKSQSAYIHANMTFFDEMSGYMKRAEDARKQALRNSRKNKRRKQDGFLADRRMDLTQYKSIVRENLDTSEAGMALNMLTGMDADYIIQAIMDGVDPKKIIGRVGMGMLMPKKVRRSVRRSDNMLNTMLKSGLSRLGSYQYDMKNHPILGMLGSIFGIDTRMSRETNLSKYNHGERTWNGEAQKALVNVIPKYLAEISANTKSQADFSRKLAKQLGIRHSGPDAAFYDMETGTYQTRAQAKALLQKRVLDARENPFANIFNGASLDPDEILDRDLWKGMSQQIQDQISELMNTAVDSVSGMTAQMNQQLQDLLTKGLKKGKKDIDVDRMMAKLVQGVQQSRQNMFDLIEKISTGESAFSQIAPDIANDLGIIEYEDLMKYLGRGSKTTRGRTSIDLRRANGGSYSFRGKNYDFMGAAGKQRTQAASDAVRDMLGQIENLPNSQNPAARKAGKLMQTMMYGRRRSKWADAASGGVDRFTAELFDIMMGTGKYFRGPGGGGSGGRNLDESIQFGADVAEVLARAGYDLGAAGARKVRGAASSAATKARGGIGAGINAGRKFRVTAGAGIHDLATSTAGKIRAATSSASPGDEDRDERNLGSHHLTPKHHNIVNQSFRESADGGPDSQQVTADATSQMRDTIENTFGEKGYMAKLYNSPLVKKMMEKFGKSKAGQAAKAGMDATGKYIGSLFSEDYVDPETGEVVESFATKMKKIANPATDKLKGALGIQETVERTAEDLAEKGEQLSESMDAVNEQIVGTEDPKKQAQTIGQAIGAKFRKAGTKIATGGALGLGASILAGGKMGLIGSMFLPGGPIGAAILGAGLNFVWKNETFQKVMFGEDDGKGNKVGGLISDKLQKSFKKYLPTFKKGAAVGVGIKLATGLLGMKGPAALATGAIPAMFGPGGIMGAALMGAAGGFILRNEKVQDILFGPADEDGKRSGTMLSKMYNRFTDKVTGGQLMSPEAKKVLKGMGVGAAAGAVMSNMGILGSALSFGGPIGGAIAGSAVGMAAMAPTFQRYLFGDIDPNDPEGKKRKGNGLLSRVSNALDLNVIEPMSNWLSETGQQFFLFVREKFETPLRVLLSPLKDLAEQAKDAATSAIELMVDKVGGTVAKAAKFVIEGIGGKFFNIVLKPMAKVSGSLAKTALMGSVHLASLPLNLLAGGFESFSKTGRKARGAINDYTSWSSFGDLIGRRREAAEANGGKYGFIQRASDTVGIGLAKTPFLRRMVRNADIMKGAGGIMEGARDVATGSTREILDAKLDQFNFHKQRMDVKADARKRKKRDKQRRKMAQELNYTRGTDMSEEQYASMVARARDLGYDINSRNEMDDFIFDFNSFKQKKEKKENRAKGELNEIEDGNLADLNAHQKTRHEEMMEVMKQIAQNTSNTADVSKAQLDLESGTVMDTDKLSGIGNGKSGGKSISEHVDEGVTAKVLQERMGHTEAAFANAIGAMREDDENKARLATLRGNDTGSGDDPDSLHMKWRDSTIPQKEKKSFLETVMDFLTGGGGGGILSSLLGGAGIAALIATVLGNEDVREFVTNAVVEGGGALVKTVAGAAWSGIKNIPSTMATAMGKDGGVNNSRALEFDEEGNVTESVTNQGMARDLTLAALHPVKTVKALGSLTAGAGKKVLSLVPGSKTVAKVVTKVTGKTTTEHTSLLTKLIKKLVEAIKACAEGNSKFAKLAGGAVKIGSKMTELIKASDDLIIKIVTKGINATHSEMLAEAWARATGNMSLGAATGGTLTAITTLIGALDGFLTAAHLFKVDPNYTTAKMNLISTVLGAVKGFSGMACVLAVIFDIVREYTGIDFECMLADFLYDLIATDKEEETRDFGREYLGTQKDVFNQLEDTNLSLQAYNDIRNESWVSKAWKTLTGQKQNNTDVYAYAANDVMNAGTKNPVDVKDLAETGARDFEEVRKILAWATWAQLNKKQVSAEELSLAKSITANTSTVTGGVDMKADDAFNSMVHSKTSPGKPSASQLAKYGLNADGTTMSDSDITQNSKYTKSDGSGVSGADSHSTTKHYWTTKNALVYNVSTVFDTVTFVDVTYASVNGEISSGAELILKPNPVRKDDKGNSYYLISSVVTKNAYTRITNYGNKAEKRSSGAKLPSTSYIKVSDVTDTKPKGAVGKGGRSRGGKPIGFGLSGYTQNDPRWGNVEIGTLPSGSRSTMADGGCGPTALANAARNLGNSTDPTSIAKFAADNGMISQGGATSDLFDRGAKALGFNSDRVSGSRGIMNSLRQGKQVILSGKGSGSDTPFTDVGHIVTATGVDGQGNVSIQDPQRPGQFKYKLSDIQRKMTGGWAISKGGANKKPAAGYGLISDLLGGFSKLIGAVYEKFGLSAPGSSSSLNDTTGGGVLNGLLSSGLNTIFGDSSWTGTPIDPTESKGRIWNYLRTKVGMSEEATAGMMGCWEVESGNRADRLEGDYVKGFPSVTDAMSSNQALNDYFLNYLWPAYKRKGKKINEPGYKGKDGNYYPGIGLAQWTGPRGENLLNFSKELGMDWRDLYAQLNFAMKEFSERKNSSKIFDATSPSDGAYKALAYYEMSEQWARDNPSALQKRQRHAEDIYATYKGTLGIGQVPDRADENFQADANIVTAGVYVIAKGKYVYNGKGEKVMSSMQDNKIATEGGVEIDGKKYAVINDTDGYFEPTKRSGPKSAIGYYVLVTDLKADKATTSVALNEAGGTTGSKMARGFFSGIFSKIGNLGTGGHSRGGKPLGFGLLDGLAGGLMNGFTTSLGTNTGLINPTTSESDGGSQNNAGGAAIEQGQQAVVNKMASIIGKLRYSLKGGEQNPDKGVASCASTVGWAYKKALGVDGMSASSTTQCKNDNFQTIWVNKGTPLDIGILQPGDVIYQNWDRTSNNGQMKHTEMYAGNGKDLSHGGPGAGPQYKDLNEYRRKHTMMVRRYKPFVDGTEFSIDDSSGGISADGGYTVSSSNFFDNGGTSTSSGTSGGIAGVLNDGFSKLTNFVYERFGLSGPSADSSSSGGATGVNATLLSNTQTDATDDSSIYGGSIATGKGFTPRLTRPTGGNKYYIRKASGGWSDACKGSPTDAQNDVLHNCVGYAYGRFNEIVGAGNCNLLRPVNAENFMDYKGNLETGAVPRVGAVMVWSKGRKGVSSDGAGHVAVVEKVKSPTEIVTSESGYNASKPFWTQNRTKGNGNWSQGSSYGFQGFIYNPAASCQPDDQQAEGTDASRDNSAFWSGQPKSKTTPKSTPIGLGPAPKDDRKGYDEKLGAFGAILQKAQRDDTKKHMLLGEDPEAGIGSSGSCIGSVASCAHEEIDTRLPASGYGGGDIHSNPNSGVETRLDRMISLLERIATSAEKKVTPQNTSLNVNYGKGDTKQTTAQPIIIKEESKQTGEHDSLHNYGRNMHRKLASRSRFL